MYILDDKVFVFFFFPFCFLHSPKLSSSPLSRLILLLLFRLFFLWLNGASVLHRELFTLMWHWGGLLKMAGAPPSSISTRFEKSFFIFSNSNSAFEQFRVKERSKLKNHLSSPPPLRCAVWVSLYIVWARRLVFFVDFSRVTRWKEKEENKISTKKTRKYLGVWESLKKILSTMNPVETNFSG